TPAPATPVVATLSPNVTEPQPPDSLLPPLTRPVRSPVIETPSPARYRVQFTVGKETHDKLRRLQALLRREIPDGDPGAIFDRAVTMLLAHVENKKLGVTARPRPPIRRETDSEDIRTPPPPSPYVPKWVQRAVWERDGG